MILNLADIQGRAGTPYGGIRAERDTRASGGLPRHAEGDKLVARAVLNQHGRSLGQAERRLPYLLRNRFGFDSQPELVRDNIVTSIYNAVNAACLYGVDEDRLCLQPGEGYIPFRYPPVDSNILIQKNIIANSQAQAQIQAREVKLHERHAGRKKGTLFELGRGKKTFPPENWLIMKRLSNEEINLFINPPSDAQLPDEYHSVVPQLLKGRAIDGPVIYMQEHYTITIPQAPNYDIDVVGNYLLFKNEGKARILFLGEQNDKPHYHAYNEGRQQWEAISFDELGEDRRAEINELTLPEPVVSVGESFDANNEQLAKIVVLLKRPKL